jgi:hypothetical protein
MIEEIVSSVVRSQVGDLKKRTAGAVLEGAGLGMIGLATVFLFTGLYLLLSQAMAAWLAALITAALAASVAAVLMMIGTQMLRREKEERGQGLEQAVKQLGLLARKRTAKPGARAARAADLGEAEGDEAEPHSPVLLVASALATGVILGRSMKR